ncbi:hypothetical protein MicloDRAFT_00003040 [Microvirga lotononidis]|uniref:Uncharacterized protein n=1 Tax=Microvirga lotononidis TaxID=864069 RepID=I4Z3I5_9HYPH|nr:hypothetical protein MicloDRAFT_00003040 [Microvirga lotononidis]
MAGVASHRGSATPSSEIGQPFTFQPANERRLMTTEADQALTSRACQKVILRVSGLHNRLLIELTTKASFVQPATITGLYWSGLSVSCLMIGHESVGMSLAHFVL